MTYGSHTGAGSCPTSTDGISGEGSATFRSVEESSAREEWTYEGLPRRAASPCS